MADIGLSPPPASKFKNVQVAAGGLKFDSKLEAARFAELKLLERAGQIRNLRTQVRFELVPAVRFQGAKRLTTAIDYVADFTYEERKFITAPGTAKIRDADEWATVIEDCKGAKTRVYLMKRHMMKALLGLDILESKPRR